MKKHIVLFLALSGSLSLGMAAYLKSDVNGNTFERVDLHAGIIKEANFIPNAEWNTTKQAGGTGIAQANVLGGGSKGSSELSLQTTNGFGIGQVITYEGNDGQYYTTVIANMNGLTATLEPALKESIASPQKINNFYADPDHPNEFGHKAIADYALRNLPDLNKGKHALLGDSWFGHSPSHFADRLASKLPQAKIINAGVGGNTTLDMLNRFDTSITPLKPNTVWVMAGTNDYNQYVSKEDYSNNIKAIIQKINDLGARAIIFNASVGKPITHSQDGKQYPTPLDTMKVLSHDYYKALENIAK